MKQFTFEESKQIYQDAKSKGLNPEEVMNSLVRKGATFEGVDMEAAKKKAGVEPNYIQRVASDFNRASERLITGLEESGSGSQIQQGFSDIKKGDIVGGVKDIAQGGQRAALRTVGTVVGAAFAPVIEAPGIKQATEFIGEQAIKVPAVEKAVSALSRYAQENPQEAKDIEDAINILTLGWGKAVEAPLIRSAKSSIDDFLEPAAKEAVPVGETFSAKTMQRVARIPKGAQSKFKQVSGEDVGEYLVNRGIYGDQDQIATQLFDRFTKSRGVADDAFAKLPGQYQDGAIKDALDELVARERRVSTPNVESPDLRRAVELQNKHDTVGLTMSETNEAKRLFEKNVRTGYFKENNADAIARSTNIDQALRNWQFKQAEMLGLDNISVVNKETQAAKQLLDAMTKEIAGTGGNNMVTLTDFIVLSGTGDPATAIAAYFGKKALGNKKLQSFVAQFFAPEATKAEIKAPIGETRFPRLPAGQTEVPTVTKPINLPSRSQSTVDMAEQELIQTKLLDKQSKLKSPQKSLTSSSNTSSSKSSLLESSKKNLKNPSNAQGGFINLGGKSDDLISEAKKYKSAEEFANKAPSKIIDELRNRGVRGAEQRMAFWEKATKGMDKTLVIDSLNPTGGVLVDYTPEARMTAKLADNITTLDKTMGKSPDEMITIYRGAPKNQKSIVGGDFVTTNYDLAKSYTGDGNVLSKKVKLSDVLDDIEDPLGEEYIYRPKSQLEEIWKKANNKK